MRLYTEVRGAGKPILCLHGHPGSHCSMGVFTDALAVSHRTVTPDLRGYGRSRVNAPFAMQAHLDDLARVVEAEADFVILGWSLGGILALELALRYPQRVRGLVLVATAARPRGAHPPVTWQDNVNSAIAAALNCAFPAWRWNINTFGKRSLFRYLVQQHTDFAYRRLAREGAMAYVQTSRQATKALSQALRQGYDRLPDLGKIQVPCLMLCGEGDRHITARSSIETAQHLPQCDLQVYPNVAHLFPWEIPHRVIGDLQDWLVQKHL